MASFHQQRAVLGLSRDTIQPSRDYPAWKQSFPTSILLQSLQLFPQVLVLRCQAGAVGLGAKHGSWNGTLQPQVPNGLLHTALPASLTQ